MNTIKVGGGKKLRPSEIIFIKADINYSIINLTSGKTVIVATTLKILEERFAESGFIRPHQSFLINPQHIVNYENGMIKLVNNGVFPFSRRKRVQYESMLK